MLLLGLCAAPAWAGIARVQSASATGVGSIQPAWSAPTVAGNLLIAVVSCRGGSGATMIPPVGWTSAARADNATFVSAAVYFVQNAASQSALSTWSCSGVNAGTVTLIEYSGAAISGGSDTSVAWMGTGTNAQTGTGVNSQAGEVAIVAFANDAMATTSAYSGAFSSVAEPQTTLGPIDAATAESFGGAGPIGVSATLSMSANWASALASFRAALPATRYWIGSGAGYFGDDTRWSSTSGGANDTAAPSGSNQTAIFDGNGLGDCLVRADPNLAGMQMLATPGSGYTGTVREASWSAGLASDWFTGTTFNTLASSYVDANVDLPDVTGLATTRTGSPNVFSVRWTGQVKANFSDTYTFYTQSDDGVRLWVNGQLVIDNWTSHSTTENSGTIALVANNWYDIRLEYFQGGGFALIQLKYKSTADVKQIIPSSNLRTQGGFYQGLSADWFAGINFDTYKGGYVDTTVDFLDTTATAVSVRWAGQVKASFSETYTFYVQSDDGVRLTVNGALLVNNWSDHTSTENSGTIALTAGQWYDVKLEYYNNLGSGTAQLKWSSASETKKIVPVGNLRTPNAPYTSGLSGDWYAGLAFDAYRGTFADTTVSYPDMTAAATSRIARSEYFSVRWTGQVRADFTETYTFYTQSDDGVRLTVNGTLLVNNWIDHLSTENSGTIALTAGQWYDIKLEYFNDSGSSVAQLSYQSASTSKQIVPSTSLRTPLVPDGQALTLGASGLDQRAGTFIGGAKAITLTGSFLQSGGAFMSTQGLLSVGGAFTRTGGTFSHGYGRTLLGSTSNQAFTSFSAKFQDLIINDGLAGYWKLDESAGTTAADASGYGGTGQYTATVPTQLMSGLPPLRFTNGSALTFGSASSGVTIPHAGRTSFTAAQSYTLAAWVNATNLSAGSAQAVVVKARDTAAWYGLYVSASPSPAWMAGANGANVLGAVVTPGWHHVAIVQNAAANRRDVYVDGASTGNGAAADGSGVGDLWIGKTSAGEAFAGSVDDVRLYNRPLTASELSALAAGNQPATGVATQTLTGSPVVAGNLTLGSGTLAGNAAITVTGSWLNCGAAYFATGAVTFNSSSAGNVILSGGQAFPALTFNGAGSWTLADRLAAPNVAVTLTNGTLAASSYTARMGSLAATAGTFAPGTGTVVLDGSAGQTLSIPSFGGLRLETAAESGLVGYWKADAGQGSRLRDYSVKGNTGTLIGGYAWASSVPPAIAFDDPAAIAFDGTTGYATMGVSGTPAANAAQSLALWAKWTSSSAVQVMVALTKASSTSAIEIGLGSGNVRVWKWGGTDLVAKVAPTDGGWHHVAYTYDGTTDKLYIDGTLTTATGTVHQIVAPDAAWLASYNGTQLFGGQLDDARVYNVALTAVQVSELAAGRYAGTNGGATVTLGTNVAVAGTLAIDDATLTTGAQALTASATGAPAVVNTGTFNVGSGVQTLAGGLTVQPGGTLALASSGGTLSIGATKALIVDGKLNAGSTGAVIQSTGGTGTSYTFKVGSTPTARPTLNITGLVVKNTDGNGMWVGADTGAVTTITRFDNIAFSNGTGNQLLQIYAKSLYLASNGCTFDAGQPATTTRDVKLTGNGTADGETRAVFGAATCASDRGSCASYKQDDDANGDGIGDNPAGNAAVVEFVHLLLDLRRLQLSVGDKQRDLREGRHRGGQILLDVAGGGDRRRYTALEHSELSPLSLCRHRLREGLSACRRHGRSVSQAGQ
jgi:hypothetical protein